MQKKVVLIGGPGTGKSTVLNQLQAKGYYCMPEISREITLEAQKQGIEQLFLEEPLLFSKKLLEEREKQFLTAENSTKELIFFDRGIPSIVAYLNYAKTSFPPIFMEKSKQYQYTKVFQFLPWKEIFKSDNERYENYTESVKISAFIQETYQKFNYEITNVPFGDVTDRCNFILNNI